jgi:(1->4)-alpha-D-glucan 1-alpha-D-glucosylmutase
MIPPAKVPRATYRLQMHADFTFEHLAQIIPYLDDLGVSDVYLSPIFCATPGSTHGYDVCDYGQINEELGGLEGLKKVSGLLRDRGMGLLADFVPNHMGIEGSLNWRWADVLEHGPLSRYAAFFDIEWNPRQTTLQERILLPLLHDFYGRVLEAGEIRIEFAEEKFWACYRSLRFPIRLASYAVILKRVAWFKNPGTPLAQKIEALAEQFGALADPLPESTPETAAALQARGDALRLEWVLLTMSEEVSADLRQVLEVLNGHATTPDRFEALHQLLEEQNYRLAYWKTGTHEINYRRFFAVDSLVGLHMEAREVFDESHEFLRDLIAGKIVTGARIDHIDGLFDPAQYLQRLSGLVGETEDPIYILVEKILADREELPPEWAAHGTTGYDFTGSLINLFLSSPSENEFTRIYDEFTGRTNHPDEQAYRLKLFIMQELFPNAVDNLVLDLEARVKSDRRWRDWTVSELRPALTRIIACLSVYRTYRVRDQPLAPAEIEVVEKATAEALRLSNSADPLPFHFIRDLWLGRYPDELAGPELKAWADQWIGKLQQYTGAIMAKAMEDTFFYRYVRLFAANEVGHHPADFGRPVEAFHEANARKLKKWPAAMLATSTHDTKMSEDVRARLLALSRLPERWDAALHLWSKLNHPAKTLVNDVLAPDSNEEYLLYQILLGAWPLEESEVHSVFVERIKQYLRKALAEAKAHTNWASPDEAWLRACDHFVETILDRQASESFWKEFTPFAENLALQGMKISLVQTALKLTSPGVPDFYQGTELWDFSLVDPDNRRPVDYGVRLELLEGLDQIPLAQLWANWKDGRIKLTVIRALLRHRREHPGLFAQGSYTPLKITGPHADHFVAFLREDRGRQLLFVAQRWMSPGEDVDEKTFLAPLKSLPSLRELFTRRALETSGAEIPIRSLFDLLPFSVFVT